MEDKNRIARKKWKIGFTKQSNAEANMNVKGGKKYTKYLKSTVETCILFV